jgi:hypothetical protein
MVIITIPVLARGPKILEADWLGSHGTLESIDLNIDGISILPFVILKVKLCEI